MPGNNNWFRINLVKGLDNHSIPFEAELHVGGADLSMSFEDAGNYTAQLIASKYNNLHLSLSGGLDSEYVACVLLKNKIPFTPVVLITPDNVDEVWFAKYFCYQHNLTPIILDFRSSSNKLLVSVLRYAKSIAVTPTVGFYPHIITKHIDPSAHVITGFGEPFSNSNDYDIPLGNLLEVEEHDFYLDLAFEDQHPGGFLSYTPELFFSLVRNIDIQKNTQHAKSLLYQIAPRIKSISQIKLPDFVPPSVLAPKPERAIIVDRGALLETSSAIINLNKLGK